jgi:hypothetical protein
VAACTLVNGAAGMSAGAQNVKGTVGGTGILTGGAAVVAILGSHAVTAWMFAFGALVGHDLSPTEVDPSAGK